MEYLSAREIAEKWNVSERYVQQRCIQGRIEGAKKFTGAWMVPADAERPSDMRRKNAKAKKQSEDAIEEEPVYQYTPMPLMNTPFAPGGMKNAVQTIENEDERNIAWAEYYYYTGNAKEAVRYAQPYLSSEHVALRLSALFIYSFANLALDNTKETRKTFEATFELYRSMDENTPPLHKGFAVVCCGSMDTLLHLPRSTELPEMQDHILTLPHGLRLFTAYVQARYAYLNGLHATAIGIAETTLVLVEDVNPISAIYVHLLCTMSYMHTHYPQMSKKHLTQAWEKAKSDGIIEPFGELHGELWGLLEAVIKKTEPEAFRGMIGIAKNFANGWREVHNFYTGNTIPTELTPTEYTVVMLVARDWRYKEISAHLGITENAVKKNVNVAMQKMYLNNKSELKKVMIPKHKTRR